MSAHKWFTAEDYLKNKLATKAVSDAGITTLPDLMVAFEKAGFAGEEGAYKHFQMYGNAEGISPNQYFNATQYLQAKAVDALGSASDYNVGLVASAIAGLGMSAWDHYQTYNKQGEGINPSNAFSEKAYLDAKAALVGKTAAEVKAAIAGIGMTVLEHYMAFVGQTGEVSKATNVAVPADKQVGGTTGQTFTLTTGVDNIIGTSGNDTVSGTIAATGATYNAFDKIDGGAGVDTLNIAATAASNFALPPATTISNVEIVSVSQQASGGTGTGALTVTNTTFGTGVQKFTYTDASAAADMIAAAVSVTLNSATDISVAAKGTGTFTTVAVTDKSTTASERGATLKNVTIEKASGAATLHGNAIETVNLNAVAGLTTVNAAAATRALTVNASGTTTQGGLTDAQATSATLNITGAQAFGTLTVAKAAEVSINSNAAASATLTAATAKSLNIGGTNLLTLTSTGNAALETVKVTGAGGVTVDLSGVTTLTSVDTTGSTAAAPASGVLTGANSIQIGTGVTYTGGAGQDVVTVGATTKAVNLGAGNDTANVTVTALGTGGSVVGGDGTDTLKLSNADAVTLTGATAAVQNAFKAAVTGFEVLDITTQTGSTVDVSKIGTFNQVNMVSASAAQVLAGITSGMTIQSTFGAAGTSITTNTLTSPSDTLTFKMTGDLSGGARSFGTLASPGVETLNLTMADTNTALSSTLATLIVTDANLKSLVVTGNNGLALTHAGTELYNIDASGLTKGAFTFTSGALATDTTAKGSATGGDTIDLSSALAKTTITAYAGTNTLKGSSGAYANTITGGSGNDTIVGGTAVDTIKAGAGSTANTITGGAAADLIDLTGSAGADTLIFGVASTSVSATGANVDVITNFQSGTDKIQLTAGDNSASSTTVSAGGLAGINLAAGSTLGTVKAVTDATTVNDIAAVYTALATSLSAASGNLAASATGAGNINAAKVTFANGTAAGTYVVINDVSAGFQGATDVVIKLVGSTDFAVTDLTVV